MTVLPVAVVVGPLAAAAVAAIGRRSRPFRRTLSLLTVAGVAAAGVALTVATRDGEVVATALGGWPGRFAIVLAADPFASLLVAVTGVLVLATLVSAVAGGEDHHPLFHPLVLVLVGGVAATFLTADLFDLFVWFEVTLVASYVLVVLDATHRQVRAAAVYVTVNLLGSFLVLVGVGLLYAAAGTVNLAVLAGELPGRGADALVPAALVLAGFAVKAALAPVGGWLPIAYPAAPRPVAALFAGTLTTVGVAAVYRVTAVAFGGREEVVAAVLVVALVTAVVGALAAAGQRGLHAVLAFQVVAQVGFMAVGAGLFGVAGVAAGVFFVVQDVVAKTAAFLGAGTAEDAPARRGELATLRPVLAGAVLVAALSLAGIPPTSGFVGKSLLVAAGLDGGHGVAAAVVLAASLLGLVALLGGWREVFWTRREAEEAPGGRPAAAWRTAPVVALAAVLLAVGVVPGWLYDASRAAAEVLVEPSRYVEAVLR